MRYHGCVKSGYWQAVFILAGTTIGAGIFGIPYVTVQAGYLVGLLWLLVLTIVTLATNLTYAYVVEHAPSGQPTQLVSYGQQAYGKLGRLFALIVILFGQWGALLVYIIGMGQFLAVLLNHTGSMMPLSLLCYVVLSILVLANLKRVSILEAWLTVGMIMIVGIIFVAGLGLIRIENITQMVSWEWARLVAPYGVIMGALGGYAVIPEVGQVIRISYPDSSAARRNFYLAVVMGTVIPAGVYFLFQLVVVGVSGISTSEDAIAGLVPYLSTGIVGIGALFGLLAMVTSFITLAFVLRHTFQLDYRFSSFRSWYLAVVPPLLVYIAGLNSFIIALEIMGTWVGTSSAIFIGLLCWRSWRRRGVSKNI